MAGQSQRKSILLASARLRACAALAIGLLLWSSGEVSAQNATPASPSPNAAPLTTPAVPADTSQQAQPTPEQPSASTQDVATIVDQDVLDAQVERDLGALENAPSRSSSNSLLEQRLAAGEPIPDYKLHRLAPGDSISVDLFDGAAHQTSTMQLDASGEVLLPLLRRVSLAGLLPLEAAQLLTERYRTFYRDPMVNVMVVSLGQIEVLVFGPDYIGHTLRLGTGTRLLDLLSRLGLTRGTYRRIHLIRGSNRFETVVGASATALPPPSSTGAAASGPVLPPNEEAVAIVAPAFGDAESLKRDSALSLPATLNFRQTVQQWEQSPGTRSWVIDPLLLTMEGALSRYNIVLAEGDVLYIPAPERYVTITGVAKPGRYELIDDETLGDLLRLAGSISTDRDPRSAIIQRMEPDGRMNRIVLDLLPILNRASEAFSVRLQHRDVISIYTHSEPIRVFMAGPDIQGRFVNYTNGQRLFDVLAGQGLVKGTYRRIHLIRPGGGIELHSSNAGLPPVASPSISVGGSVPLDLACGGTVTAGTCQVGAPPAGQVGRTLDSQNNWRRWIAERQYDPKSQVWIIDPLCVTVEDDMDAYYRYNIELHDGDVLYVPAPERYVDISGVAKSGRLELLSETTLGDVLRLTGSVDYDKDLRNAVVERFAPDGRLVQLYYNVYPLLQNASAISGFVLQNRDKISFMAPERRVFVLGEVVEGGAFTYVSDSTVLDYLALAKSHTPEANMAWVAIIRQNRDRLDPHAAAEVIRVNFKDIHHGECLAGNYFPLPGDVIYVPPKGQEFKVTDVLSALGPVVSAIAIADRNSDNSTP
jgi:protein involved in polysaccharide export with SLBB domain